MNRRHASLALVAGLLLSSWKSDAQAFEFTPIIAQFAPKGPGATRSFIVRNTQKEALAVQIEVVKRGYGADGAEIRTPENDDFIVTPPQLVIAPGASQNVRVQWIGESDPEHELSYRFIVSQVPIKYAKSDPAKAMNATLLMGYKYETAVYITPPSAKPEAKLVSVEPATGKDGAKVMRVTLASVGTTRAILQRPQLTVTPPGGGAVTLSAEQLRPLEKANVIAGATIPYDIPWPENVPYGPVQAEFSTGYSVFR